LSEPIEWGGFIPFQEILRSRSREKVSAQAQDNVFKGPLFSHIRAKTGPALQPVDEPTPLDMDDVAALLEQGGAFSRFFPEYEYRAQQVEMLRAVTQALSQHRHLLVEAAPAQENRWPI